MINWIEPNLRVFGADSGYSYSTVPQQFMQKEVKPFLSQGGIDDSLSLPCPDEEKIKLLYVLASP